MTTSGTYVYNPSLGDATVYAFNLCEIRPTALTQEHMASARMASNMVLARWSNQGVNLWAVDLQTVTLVAGQAAYPVPQETIVILDAYCTIAPTGSASPTDRIILPISRTEYANYPNKLQQGFPTVFWFDRLISSSRSSGSAGPQILLYPTPDGTSAQTLSYYRVRQLQDSNLTNGQTVEIPYLWMEAFATALAVRLAIIWKPEKAIALKSFADESYSIASLANIETAQQYLSPMIGHYFQ